MTNAAAWLRLRLTMARACAWALLLGGWVGLGGLAATLAPPSIGGFGLVALWLLAIGAAARVATRGDLGLWAHRTLLGTVAAATVGGLWWAIHGGGLLALLLALAAWAALAAMASGVVRSLRLACPSVPRPPLVPASIGALGAALFLGDLANMLALAQRLMLLAVVAGCALILLRVTTREDSARPGCRAGLFDCSLPSWPAGAWREPMQWPTLIAGLVMLPAMASLPLMENLCRVGGVAPKTMVLLHLAAMFGPALMLRHWVARWSERTLATVCAALLTLGAALAVGMADPYNLLGTSVAQGAAWGLAWSGQLWAPARRGQQGTSPLHAAAGYAVLTLAFGGLVDRTGARGLILMHAGFGLAAGSAWLFAGLARLRARRPSLPGIGTPGAKSAQSRHPTATAP
jgi:hypothetical protein